MEAVLEAEPRGGHGGKGVDRRVVEVHPRQEQGERRGRREHQEDDDQGLGGFGDARRHPGIGEPRYLRTQQTCRSYSDRGGDRHKENDDPYAPDPLGHAQPEV